MVLTNYLLPETNFSEERGVFWQVYNLEEIQRANHIHCLMHAKERLDSSQFHKMI